MFCDYYFVVDVVVGLVCLVWVIGYVYVFGDEGFVDVVYWGIFYIWSKL